MRSCSAAPRDESFIEPAVLEAQVRRMLRDAKSAALVENFGGQWLQTRALESHTPDRVKFKEFTDYTRLSMKKETDLFFEHVIREDRTILDFIDANYTFLNQRLAEFYQIPGVKGHEFRKVDLTGTRRGGVLTQASVLTVSSYANRTSPVLRGKWILENLLNAPPPPPPANVPSLDEQGLGPVRVAARAIGEAPRQCDLCVVPRPHGPAGACPGALRRHRRLARPRRQLSHRHGGNAARRPVLRRSSTSFAPSCAPSPTLLPNVWPRRC